MIAGAKGARGVIDLAYRIREFGIVAALAILMISSELPEVLRVADRMLVMREGRLVAEFDHAHASEETIVAAATGQVEAVA